MFVDKICHNQWMGETEIDNFYQDSTWGMNPEVVRGLPEREKKQIIARAMRDRDFLERLEGDDGLLHLHKSSNVRCESHDYVIDLIRRSQRFLLSSAFTRASLKRLATNDTIVKAKSWLKLLHNPMFMEWDTSGIDSGNIRKKENIRIATLLWQEEGCNGIECVTFDGITGLYFVTHTTMYPDSLKLDEDGNVHINTYSYTKGDNCLADAIVPSCVDFLIRMNSDKITDMQRETDLSAINRKRVRNGKQALFSYRIVDLRQSIKDDLLLMERQVSDSHMRRHWRRGHFKCCRTGIFWWNPHLAGREELGFVDKHYVA